MPEEIVTRILRLPGYGVGTWEADDEAGTLTLWVRQTRSQPTYRCGGCGARARTSTVGGSGACGTCRGGPGRFGWW